MNAQVHYLPTVNRLDELAAEINEAQAEIEYAGKTMLRYAKKAGEALSQAKKSVPPRGRSSSGGEG